jgi:hypothetical protein
LNEPILIVELRSIDGVGVGEGEGEGSGVGGGHENSNREKMKTIRMEKIGFVFICLLI